MRRILLVLGFLVVGAGFLAGQNVELRLLSGIGISPSNLDAESDWIENEIHSHLIPIGLDANYFFFPEKRLRLFLGAGLEYSRNNYFQNVMDLEYGNNLTSMSFSQRHLGAAFRIGAEWKFFHENAIGFQFGPRYNFAMKKEVEDKLGGVHYNLNGEVDLQYTCSLTSRTTNFLSGAFSLYLKTQVANNLFVITALECEFRPSSGDYDFSTYQLHTKTDVATGEQFQTEASSVFEKIEIRNNILGLKLGLTKYF
ncbi:MAG: hypothetical protein WA004_20570 [Saprospiraceae bacterium]